MATGTLMTASEFERIAARLGPCELVRGEVLELSPGGLSHGGISANLAILLGNWARRTRRGRVFVNETGLITEREPDTVRGGDVVYYSYRRLPKRKTPEGFSDVPPELVVEVVGKGQGWRQMMTKAGEYFRMGVDRVWIIDPKRRRLAVLHPDTEPDVLMGAAEVSDPEILPGFSCSLADIFAL